MQAGDFEVRVVSGGRFRLDGGAMFGIIPRPLWEKELPPDERHRIVMEANCLLLRGRGEVVLFDSGIGSKLDEKERRIFAVEPGNRLLENLAAAGARPEEVTAVVYTHLHMDHAGGGTLREGETLRPTFPNARYFVQRLEWEDALANRSTMRVTYRPENLLPLQEAGQLFLVAGDAAILPGIRVEVTLGHTRGHQSIFVETGEQTLFYPGDLCPTRFHLRAPYNMAYDLYPYENMLRKRELLERAAREEWLVAFDHDPDVALATVTAEGEGRFRALERSNG